MSTSRPGAFKPGRFSDLDQADQRSEYVSYLEQTGIRLREFSRARYGLLNVRSGDRVIDVGCGLGDNAREIAALVAPRGSVVALDSSAVMVAQARHRSQRPGLGPAVEFAVGDAHQLPLADASFSACWSERVLQHVADPGRAVAEMVRVIKPGGRLVVFEPDHATLVIDADDRATSRAMALALADSIRSSWVGRSLFALFKAHRLKDVRVMPTPIVSYSLSDTNLLLRLDATAKAAIERGLISEQAAARWFGDLEQRQADGLFFGCMLCFAAVGEKA